MRSTFEDVDGLELRPLSSRQEEVEPLRSAVNCISASQKEVRRLSTASAQSFELYTPDEERAVVRKLDTRVVLFMSFLYLLSFLDRSSKNTAIFNLSSIV